MVANSSSVSTPPCAGRQPLQAFQVVERRRGGRGSAGVEASDTVALVASSLV